MTYSENRWETKDGIQLFAYQYKTTKPQKGVLCLIHGIGEHSKRYVHVAQVLNEAGYSFATFDLRGHGKSQGQRGHYSSLDVCREDISTFVEKTRSEHPGLPIFLYGHSLGGMLALSLLVRNSPTLAGIISSAPVLRLGFDPPSWQLVLGRTMRSIMPTFSMANGLDRTGLSRDPEVIQAYADDPLVHDRVSAQLGIDFIEEGLWLLETNSQTNLQVLLMHGSEDRICSPKGSMEFAETAGDLLTLKIWDGLYHEIHNEPEKDQVLEYLIQWLNEKIK